MTLPTKGRGKDTQGMGNSSAKNQSCESTPLKSKGQRLCGNDPQKSPEKSSNVLPASEISNDDSTPPKLPFAASQSPVEALEEPNDSSLSDNNVNLKQVVEDPAEPLSTGFVSNMDALDYPVSSSLKSNLRFDLDVSMSYTNVDMDYGSPCNDGISLLAQRSSEISELSSTETDGSLFDLDNLTLDSQDSSESLLKWEIHSPKKPLSAMGKFLNKRKFLKKRERFASVDTINSSVFIKDLDSRKLAFLKTV